MLQAKGGGEGRSSRGVSNVKKGHVGWLFTYPANRTYQTQVHKESLGLQKEEAGT